MHTDAIASITVNVNVCRTLFMKPNIRRIDVSHKNRDKRVSKNIPAWEIACSESSFRQSHNRGCVERSSGARIRGGLFQRAKSVECAACDASSHTRFIGQITFLIGRARRSPASSDKVKPRRSRTPVRLRLVHLNAHFIHASTGIIR